jgi:hypothetical protein
MGQGEKKAQSWNDNFEAFMEQEPVVKEVKEPESKAVENPENLEPKQDSEFIDDKRLYLMNLSY